MGAFKDLFKSKEQRAQTNNKPAPLPQPLWALATEPAPRPSRPVGGPRSPSKRSELASSHGASSSSGDAEAAAARALAGRQAGERVRQSLLHKRRRRTASLDELSRGLGRVSIDSAPGGGASPTRKPLPATPPPRAPVHQRTQSTPADVFRQQQQLGTSPGRPRPLHSQSHSAQPPSPPKGRPSPPSNHSSPTKLSLYPQAMPNGPRAPIPPVPRGPNPVRQVAPPSAPQSRNVSAGSSFFSPPMLPGSFPRAVDAGLGADSGQRGSMPEPRCGQAAMAVIAQGHEDVSCLRYPPQQCQQHQVPAYQPQGQHYFPTPSSSQPCLAVSPPAPPPIVQSRPSPRRIPASASAPLLSSMTRPAPGGGNNSRLSTQVIDLTVDSALVTPTTPPRTPPASRNQCHGTTGTGKRCTRAVGGGTPGSSPAKGASGRGAVAAGGGMEQLEVMLDEDDDGKGVVRFCFQHAKQAMGERGCFVTPRVGRGKWIEFEDWILPDLPVQTKILLRHEMATPVSAKDEEGYIYVHEMVERSPSRSSPPHPRQRTTFLKLGRSIHPIHRLSQWRSQCPSREPIVRGIFPLPSSSTSASGGVGLSGALRVADKGTRNHHRWERLVLIEVAGRTEVELGARKGVRKECDDCGRAHLELFEVGEGAFDEWVAEVVERWGRWCADVLG